MLRRELLRESLLEQLPRFKLFVIRFFDVDLYCG